MMPRKPQEEPNTEEEAEICQEDTDSLKQALAAEREKAEDYLANWQRTQADFINYKRRSEQESEESRKFANSVLILSMLPVLDDFERALDSIDDSNDKAEWIDGIRLIERKLRASLEAQGLTAIEAKGEAFDPRLHEAIRQSDGQEGIVLEEVQKGYRLHDRILRPAMVVVGNGEGTEERENKSENNGQDDSAGI
jgi:molecular chaperone GrpE